MRRAVVLVTALLCAIPAGAGRTQAQAEPRRLALIYDLDLPPLFTPTGEVAETAAFSVETFLRRIRALETDHLDRRFALSVSGVACDELSLVDTEPAQRALDALRRLARTRAVLRTAYASTRLDHLDADGIAEQVRRGDRALERCIGERPVEPFVPAANSVATLEAASALARAGVSSTISAFAVPPADPRPRVVPAVVVGAEGDVPDLATARPEAGAIAIVLDGERLPLLGDLTEDERFETVNISALRDSDVIGGVIDPSFRVSATHERALRRADAELELFESYTLPDNPLRPILRTVVARAASTALWGPGDEGARHARELVEALVRRRAKIAVSDGTVTFTSRSGSVPVTITNDTGHSVRLLIEMSTAKMRFADGASRVVVVEPPGGTITFSANALSTGTFPVQVVVSDPTHAVRFDTARVDVRSAAANLSALVLTGGGALFLAWWFISRLRRRGTRSAEETS